MHNKNLSTKILLFTFFENSTKLFIDLVVRTPKSGTSNKAFDFENASETRSQRSTAEDNLSIAKSPRTPRTPRVNSKNRKKL